MPLKTSKHNFEPETHSRKNSSIDRNDWDLAFQVPKRAERPVPIKGANVLKGFIFPV